MNLIPVALRGKGLLNLIHRAFHIIGNYGLTPTKMDNVLQELVDILETYNCSATLPVTTLPLARNPEIIKKYAQRGLEFPVHGYRHIDHAQLSLAQQDKYLTLAKQVFNRAGIEVKGFRGPYLHWNDNTITALSQHGFMYDASQGLAWDVLNGTETPAYEHVLGFYGAVSANDYPSVPKLTGNIVNIPYSLPDDESLIERLELTGTEAMKAPWLAILQQSYNLGELFVLGLHPERTSLCREALIATLAQARSLTPAVWIARLEDISAWWQAKTTATAIKITPVTDDENKLQLTITGSEGLSVLARNVIVEDAPISDWYPPYREIKSAKFTIPAHPRPFIGLSPGASPALTDFLSQQGYITETSQSPQLYNYYLNAATFSKEEERPLLAQLENSAHPLIKINRWPHGARSALSITGDIDSLTLWDYIFRAIGR